MEYPDPPMQTRNEIREIAAKLRSLHRAVWLEWSTTGELHLCSHLEFTNKEKTYSVINIGNLCAYWCHFDSLGDNCKAIQVLS
jgi:hypothetical protein